MLKQNLMRILQKIPEIKEKASQSIKLAMEKKNIQIDIEPGKIVIPLNKYEFKRSKLLVLEIGKFEINNTEGDENYNEQYLLNFSTLSIVYLQSINDLNTKKIRFEIVSDLRLNSYWMILR
jgi:hypothetical protein